MKVGVQILDTRCVATRDTANKLLQAAGPVVCHLFRPGALDPSRVLIVGSGSILFAVDGAGSWTLPTGPEWVAALELRTVRHLRDAVAEIGAEIAPLLPALSGAAGTVTGGELG